MCCVSMLFRVGSVGGVSCSLPLLLLRRGVEKADDAMVVGCLIGEDSRELIVLVVGTYYASIEGIHKRERTSISELILNLFLSHLPGDN